MTEQTEVQKRDHRFVEYLYGLAERQDRAALADLRRGLGQEIGSVISMYRHVIPRAPQYRKAQDLYFLVAALFTMNTQRGPRESLGKSMSRIKNSSSGDKSDSVDGRFNSLLAADLEDIPSYLRQVISLLNSKAVPVDWERLLRDLSYWDHPDRFVQLRWAQDFWAPSSQSKESG